MNNGRAGYAIRMSEGQEPLVREERGFVTSGLPVVWQGNRRVATSFANKS